MPRFSTHTTRHLCLTDLARMGWELHAIAAFAGHRSTDSTLAYIHLSGRDLADKLARGMDQIHAWRVDSWPAWPTPQRRTVTAASPAASAVCRGDARMGLAAGPRHYDRRARTHAAEAAGAGELG